MSLDVIPQSHRPLLSDEVRAFAFLATTMEDGSPQVTPVWFNTDGEHILINSKQGRVKDENIRQRPNVALAIQDPDDPYRYLQIRGRVVEITTEGAREHIDHLAYKYTGDEQYKGFHPGDVRVTYVIESESVSVMG
ncbi:MAG TPA: PPOX class F420-dependent oxidoreductase [Anaerolineales bacterium]